MFTPPPYLPCPCLQSACTCTCMCAHLHYLYMYMYTLWLLTCTCIFVYLYDNASIYNMWEGVKIIHCIIHTCIFYIYRLCNCVITCIYLLPLSPLSLSFPLFPLSLSPHLHSLPLHHLRQTVLAFNGFIDSLYKISEVAHNTKGKTQSPF